MEAIAFRNSPKPLHFIVSVLPLFALSGPFFGDPGVLVPFASSPSFISSNCGAALEYIMKLWKLRSYIT